MMLQIQNYSRPFILGIVLTAVMAMSAVSAGWIWKPAGMGGMTGMYYAPGMGGARGMNPAMAGMYRAPGMAGMRGIYRPRGMSGMSLTPGMAGMHRIQRMNPGIGGQFKIVEKTWIPPCN